MRLRAIIRDRTGRDFICRSDLVLAWMAQPERHLQDMAVLYQEFPSTHSCGPIIFYTSTYDLHSFLSLLECVEGGLLEQFMEMLAPEAVVIAALHDHEGVRRLAAERVGGGAFHSALNNFAKAKTTLRDIGHAMDCVTQTPAVAPVLAASFSRYKLWDPDGNGLSSLLKYFNRIKYSRLLYFALADDRIFPLFAQAQDCLTVAQARSMWGGRERFSWHIEAVVLRCILLFLSHRQRQQALAAWSGFFDETSHVWGYDGHSGGFNRDTLKMLDAFSKAAPPND